MRQAYTRLGRREARGDSIHRRLRLRLRLRLLEPHSAVCARVCSRLEAHAVEASCAIDAIASSALHHTHLLRLRAALRLLAGLLISQERRGFSSGAGVAKRVQ